MGKINEGEFARIVDGILEDRDSIIRHNPMGSGEEILLWMLLSCLITYLSLEANETPCFTGRPDVSTYRDAIRFVVSSSGEPKFDPEPHLAKLSKE